MRDLESRERKALEEMLGRAELSSAAVRCYPGCRIPIPANADPQSTGGFAAETRRIKRDLKRWMTRGGVLETYGGGGEFKALLQTQLRSKRRQEGGRGGTPKATGPLGPLHTCCPCQGAELNVEGARGGSLAAVVGSLSGRGSPGGDKTAATWWASAVTSKLGLAR